MTRLQQRRAELHRVKGKQRRADKRMEAEKLKVAQLIMEHRQQSVDERISMNPSTLNGEETSNCSMPTWLRSRCEAAGWSASEMQHVCDIAMQNEANKVTETMHEEAMLKASARMRERRGQGRRRRRTGGACGGDTGADGRSPFKTHMSGLQRLQQWLGEAVHKGSLPDLTEVMVESMQAAKAYPDEAVTRVAERRRLE